MKIAVEEAADLLGISPRTVYRFLAEGRLTRYKLGGRTRVDPDELDSLFVAE